MADKRLTIPENMGKDQEIALIYDFYQVLPQDSYLKRMLARFPAYAEQQIQDDFGIDPQDTIDHNYREISQLKRDVEAAVDPYIIKVKQLEDQLAEANRQRDNFKRAAQEWQESYTGNEKKLDAAYDDIKELTVAKHQLEGRAMVDRDTMKDLKARLFDYMTKEQAGA